MLKFGLYWLTSIQWIVLIPVYIILAPICMISSSLFDWVISWIVQDQTFTLVAILTIEWAVSVLLIFQLMISRTGKAIFFYQFVFFVVCSNFILIGITYTLLQRSCILEEFAAKVCTSLMLVLVAEKMKIQFKNNKQPCTICFETMTEECIILKCSHIFHESCLWNWVYIKQECPSCKKKI